MIRIPAAILHNRNCEKNSRDATVEDRGRGKKREREKEKERKKKGEECRETAPNSAAAASCFPSEQNRRIYDAIGRPRYTIPPPSTNASPFSEDLSRFPVNNCFPLGWLIFRIAT